MFFVSFDALLTSAIRLRPSSGSMGFDKPSWPSSARRLISPSIPRNSVAVLLSSLMPPEATPSTTASPISARLPMGESPQSLSSMVNNLPSMERFSRMSFFLRIAARLAWYRARILGRFPSPLPWKKVLTTWSPGSRVSGERSGPAAVSVSADSVPGIRSSPRTTRRLFMIGR